MKRKFRDGEERLFGRSRCGDYSQLAGIGKTEKTDTPVSMVPGSGASPREERAAEDAQTETVLRAFVRMMDLKGLYRQGWLKRGVPELRAESVADHSFGTALLALLLADHLGETDEFAGLDPHRCIEMALIHELGEVYAGDITPADGVPKEEKYRREREALVRVVAGLPEAERFLALWEEFEAGTSPEARFIRQLDRLEMGIQAVLLKSEGFAQMDEFIESARKSVTHRDLQKLLVMAETRALGDTQTQ